MPTVAGIFMIVAAAFTILRTLGRALFGGFMARTFWGFIGLEFLSGLGFVVAVIVMIAGILALTRRVWWLALIGATITVFDSFLLGIPALILIAMSKNEFKG